MIKETNIDIDSIGIALFGPRYKDELAKKLGYASGRTIRRWLEDGPSHTPPPDDLPDRLSKLIDERLAELNELKAELKKLNPA